MSDTFSAQTRERPAAGHGQRSVAQHLAARLAECVSHLFAVPGSHGLEIFDAVFEQPDLTGIVVRHEQSAVFAADGFARASGRFGVCVSSTGPGLLNSLTGTAAATGDGIPVLNIATCADSQLSGTGAGLVHEVGDQLAAAAEASRWIARIRSAHGFVPSLEYALCRLAQPATGAFTVEVPKDILSAPLPPAPSGEFVAPGKPQVNEDAVARAAELIRQGRRPLIWAGVRARGWEGDPVGLIARAIEAPVFSSVLGKGIVDEADPLSLGVFDATNPTHAAAMSHAEPLILVGVDLTHQDTSPGCLPPGGSIIRLDAGASDIPLQGPDSEAIIGDLTDICGRLTALCADGVATDRKLRRRALVSAIREDRLSRARLAPAAADLIRVMRKALPADAILVNDITAASYWARELFPVSTAGSFLYPWRYAPLGYALPAAIGAHFAAPGRPVVALCGDGGFLFTATELATVQQYSVPVICLIIDNGGYGLIRERQSSQIGRTTMADLVNPDFVALGRSFGIDGTVVSDVGKLEGVIRVAVSRQEPYIACLRLDIPHPTLTSTALVRRAGSL